MKKLKLITLFVLGIITLSGGFLPTAHSFAETCPSGQKTSDVTNKCAAIKRAIDCPSGKVSTSDSTACVPLGNGCKDSKTSDACLSDNPIISKLNEIVNVLSALVGIVVIGVIILGGIQYSLAGDNPTATGAAKKRIINGLIALLAFIFTFAFLQWLIPGGIFS